MEEFLLCESCRVLQSKKEEFRESQWDNPRPTCNSCATKHAWSMFAADIAACPNAHVIHNHGKPEAPKAPPQIPTNATTRNSKPAQWEKDAAEKIKMKLDQTPDTKEPPQDNDGNRSKWCHGCKKGVAKAQRCSQCQRVFFCSVACQRSSWPTHKQECVKLVVDATQTQKWTPVLAATASASPDESWQAFNTIQAWISDKETLAVSIAAIRALDGIGLFLQHLENEEIDLEIKWQILLLLTRLIELSPEISKDVHHLGGVYVLLNLVKDSMDFRVQASAVIALGALLSANPSTLAPYFLELEAMDAFLTVLHQASSLDDEVELVACVQATALILQILEHDNNSLSQLLKFEAQDQGSIASLLVKLMNRMDTMYKLNRSTGVPVGHHLYLNILSLVGALVHAHPDCKESFVAAGLLPLITSTVEDKCLHAAGFKKILKWWEAIWFWFISFVQAFIYDWKVRLSSSEALEVADRLLPILTPFLSNSEWCGIVTEKLDGVLISAQMLKFLVQTDADLAIRTRLSALDLFVCMCLPPYDANEQDRHVRIHDNLSTILPTLDTALKFALVSIHSSDANDKDESGGAKSTLKNMFLTEVIKCSGLIAHFGRSMPSIGDINIPSTLCKIIIDGNIISETKWIAMASLIQWDSNGNRVDLSLVDGPALQKTVDELFSAKDITAAQKQLEESIQTILNR